MRKDDVIAYFGGTQTATAEALGITKSAVNQWPEPPKPIPLKCAIKANAKSNGDLALDMALYELPEISRRGKSHRRHVNA